MKKGERESAREYDARDVRIAGVVQCVIAIRNAAVAITDHSEATARIAISWRVLPGRRSTLERILASHHPDNQHPYFSLTKALHSATRCLVSFVDVHLDWEQTENGFASVLFPLFPRPSFGWLIAESAA